MVYIKHAGKAWVSIHVQLGLAPGQEQNNVLNPFPRKHRSPSYHRRQAKRKAARTAAEVHYHLPIL